MKNSKEFQELLDRLSAYTYGILYNDGKFVTDQDEIARRDGTGIIVQTPEMMDQHKSGMCHDATLYVDKALNVFEIPHKCVYIASHVKPELKTHSFVLVNDEDSQDWIIVDVFASENCICTAGSFKYWSDAVDTRIASWIKDDNRNSANLSVFVLDHMPEGNKGFVEYSQEIVSLAEEYEFDYGYSHLEYENTGIYQALKEAAGWNWKDIIKSENISWLPKPPEYNGSYESYFTMKGYRKFQEKVMPVIEKYLDTARIVEKYIDEIDQDSIIYSDEFQVIKKKFDSFNRLFEEVMNKIKNTTIDCDAFLAVEETELNPIWIRQFSIMNEYVEDPELIPVPKQVLIDFVKDLRTKKDSIKTFSYKEIYEKLHDYDYEYSEEFKNNLLKYNVFSGHLTVAILENNADIIHQYLDKEFDFLKVNDMIKKMNDSPTGIIDSWNKDLSTEDVIQKNVVILINRSLIIYGQDWKDSLEHELTHFIQRIVGLDKSLKKKMQYFGQKPEEKLTKFKEEILGKTKLNKSYVDAVLNRFIAYIINPVEHDSSIKSCLNAFQREYERSKSKIDRNEWLNMKLSTLDNNFIEVFDEYFPKDKRTINSYEEMMKHKFLFAILIYKIMNCLGYNMDEKLKNHFKIFRYRDV